MLRGIAIAIVIFGHALQKICGVNPPHPVHSVILCFQMEFFFAIAGYAQSLTSNQPFVESIKKRAMRLMVPYLVWVTISFVYGLYTGNAQLEISSIGCYYFKHAFWFLRTMFYVSGIYLVAASIKRRCAMVLPHWVAFVAAGCIVAVLTVFCRYVFADEAVPRYLVWFYIGYGFSYIICLRKEECAKRHSKVAMFIAYLGQESLALYAIHWWVFFKFLPLPDCPISLSVVTYAFCAFVVWLLLSLGIIRLMSKTIVARLFLGKSAR